jgi:hypothetical protein
VYGSRVRWWLALAVIVATGTARPRLAAADDLRGDVKIWRDAELRVEPDAPAFHVATIDGKRADHPDATVAVHVIATRGKLVEVEPACGSLLRGRGLAHLHLFVARADIVGKPKAPDPACRDLAVAIDDSPVAEGRDAIPVGTELSTPSGRAVATAAAPIVVTLVPGAKRVCIERDVVLDGAGSSPIRVCAAAKSVQRGGASQQHLSTR